MLSSAISCVEQRGGARRRGGGGGRGWEWRTERRGEEDERKLHRKKGEAGEESERWLGWEGSQKAAVVCRGCDTGEFRCTPHCSGEQSGELALLQCGV